MRFRSLLFCLLLCSSIGVAWSQGDKKFTRLGVEDGLSQSWVRKLAQDSHGFMWFGTKDGLNRYDGRDFRVYRPESENMRGLESGSINELYLDAAQTLWVCTLGGVFRYDEELDRFELFEPIGRATVSTVLQAWDGSYWFGTPNELFRYEPDSGELKRYLHEADDPASLPSNIVWNLLEDRRKRLWIGTDEGLCLYDRRNDSFTRLDDAQGAGDRWVQSMLEDDWGRVWVGTEDSIYLYELGDWGSMKVEKVMDIRGQCIAEDQNGDIWLGHASAQGLTFWEIADETGDLLEKERYFNRLHDERSLSADGVDCIYVDDTGGVWIGTYGNGANYFSGAQKRFVTTKIHDTDGDLDVGEQVNSVLIDGEQRWVGTERGLVRYDGTTDTFHEYKSIAEDPSTIGADAVYQIFKDSRGDIWVGAWAGGLNRYVPESDSFVRYLNDPSDPNSLSNNNVFCIYEDRNGYLWIGTVGGGLNQFDPENETFVRHVHDPEDSRSINSQYINDIEEDEIGNLWISTYSSLDKYDPGLGYFQHFSHTGDPLPQNRGDLEVVFFDSLNQLWLGTEVGLISFDPDAQRYTRYSVSDGLPNNSIKSISEDSRGNLWITTNQGLSQFVDGVSVPARPRFINYDRKDGLQSKEFVKRSSFVAADGQIWVGGVSGLTHFRPDEIEPNLSLPKVVITDLSVLNRKVFPSPEAGPLSKEPYLLDEVKLRYEDSVFSFRFSSLVYPRNDDVEYAYMLEGFDEAWQYVRGASTAIYTNLDPGRYTFRVKSSNSDGIWGDNAETIFVTIAPAWWKSIWFRLFGLLVVGLALFLAYRLRVISLKRSRLALAKSVEDRTRELAEAKEELSLQNEELKVHRAHLEELVEARTRELKAARDKAEVSDRLKSAFIGNMSHEIRTPLNAIMGFSQLIAMEAEGRGEFDNYSNCIRENTEMLVQLLNDILDFSIFESEKLTLNYETIDAWMLFHELSVDIGQLVKSRAPAGVEYVADDRLGDGLTVRFEADKVRVRQILLNLATNACKFTEQGIVSFGMSLNRETKTLKYWVEDTGVGIAPSEHEAVFERFHKIIDNTKSFAKGTGLGLAICRRLSDELGFQLSLKSELGKGSVFTVEIPVELVAESSQSRKPSKQLGGLLPELDLVGRRILVAEDIVNNYTILERFLEPTGARLIHALDGEQAIRQFREFEGKIDLLLLDISMPNLGGIEALKAIREMDPDVPAIALTAHAFKNDVDALLDAGFQSCLTKPVERKHLFREIAGFLDSMPS
ncbi:response regulator [Pelagicoccus sp. NFK12]|uniref:histidine kinase n=1 Tax=Pelagicoccus enzymogenes TaxID=2773457 RepID=A0A927FB85_9BACT|nr:hybrid sensor histidine kinase/response regulator [Pelagicoccus enzymogenes]MBD5780258.1 response regulator [Pelagicoccus enzymogenes]